MIPFTKNKRTSKRPEEIQYTVSNRKGSSIIPLPKEKAPPSIKTADFSLLIRWPEADINSFIIDTMPWKDCSLTSQKFSTSSAKLRWVTREASHLGCILKKFDLLLLHQASLTKCPWPEQKARKTYDLLYERFRRRFCFFFAATFTVTPNSSKYLSAIASKTKVINNQIWNCRSMIQQYSY